MLGLGQLPLLFLFLALGFLLRRQLLLLSFVLLLGLTRSRLLSCQLRSLLLLLLLSVVLLLLLVCVLLVVILLLLLLLLLVILLVLLLLLLLVVLLLVVLGCVGRFLLLDHV